MNMNENHPNVLYNGVRWGWDGWGMEKAQKVGSQKTSISLQGAFPNDDLDPPIETYPLWRDYSCEKG